MDFRNINLKLIYDNSTDDIVSNLIVPILEKTKKYYRGVGYFSSNWLKITINGIKSIVENNGSMYLLTSPQLSEEDWNAIQKGEQAKKEIVIYNSIISTINNFDINTKENCLNLLSWLIADGFLNLKIVICKNNNGFYHDKIAIFEDELNNKICIHGSLNDSLQSTYNGECVSVFKSWNIEQNEYIKEHLYNFFNIWDNHNSYYEVIEISDMLKIKFSEYKKERPYKLNNNPYTLEIPSYIKDLKSYQKEAIEKLKQNNWCGILEMATGTGKTITSLTASKIYYEENKKIFLIVVVPFTHLAEQWSSIVESFKYKIIIKCYENISLWENKLISKIMEYNSGFIKNICIITTYKTASTDNFIENIKKLKTNVFLISDECHYSGSKNYNKVLQNNINHRIGLSATPMRWFDDVGSKIINEYFLGTVFKFTLEEAIEKEFLVTYNYYPSIIYLTDDEFANYNKLTKQIVKLLQKENNIEDNSILEILLIKRAEILNKANNKINKLIEILKEQQKIENIHHSIIYCARGDNKKITKILSSLGIKTHNIVYDVSNDERLKIIDRFYRREIQVLVAIKCLDEGVDIPNIKNAYFLSNSSNPKEFIQRRGRILRKHKDKKNANIFDFIVFPNNQDEYITNKSIISKEMPRFAEFSNHAENKYFAREIILKILKNYNLEYLMDKLPWDIYKELRSKDESYTH